MIKWKIRRRDAFGNVEKCREGKKEERIAKIGIGINQQVNLDTNKWKKVMQQVERRKM